MVLLYIAGIISGIILLSIALYGWIHKSANEINRKEKMSAKSYSSTKSLEDYRKNRSTGSNRHIARAS